MTRKEFHNIVNRHGLQEGKTLVVPIVRRHGADMLTPVSAYLAMRKEGTHAFLLESVEGGERMARYSFLGRGPYQRIEARGGATQLYSLDDAGNEVRVEDLEGGFFDAVQGVLDRYEEVAVPDIPRLRGGAVGFVAYDAVRLLEYVGENGDHSDSKIPDAVWCFYRSLVAFDHVKHQAILIGNALIEHVDDADRAYDIACQDIADLETILKQASFERPEPVSLENNRLESNMSREAFERAVVKAKHHIFEGDALQIVLSQRFDTKFSGDRFNLYRALRQVNPSPYLYYLDFDKFALIGSSPEVLVRVEDGRVELLPIAGTRPRGQSEEEDRQLATELLADAKERAEHAMLVDLGRNDLGRVCEIDSVTVEDYAYIERYSHVMHIVSSVVGKLTPGLKPMDVLAACFPAGTVSGAPKVAAMRIIDRLENDRRGVYAGAVGYVDFSGNIDTCIAIRTMIVDGDTVSIQAGAGIVTDSDPASEYDETVNKARALREAIRVAAEELI